MFDTPIDWGQRPLTTGAFFAGLILGVYGAGYGGGHKLAFRYAAYAIGALALIVAIRELPQFIGIGAAPLVRPPNSIDQPLGVNAT